MPSEIYKLTNVERNFDLRFKVRGLGDRNTLTGFGLKTYGWYVLPDEKVKEKM